MFAQSWLILRLSMSPRAGGDLGSQDLKNARADKAVSKQNQEARN